MWSYRRRPTLSLSVPWRRLRLVGMESSSCYCTATGKWNGTGTSTSTGRLFPHVRARSLSVSSRYDESWNVNNHHHHNNNNNNNNNDSLERKNEVNGATSTCSSSKVEEDEGNEKGVSSSLVPSFFVNPRCVGTAMTLNVNSDDNEDVDPETEGYLNRILNARVYEAAVETELCYAKTLSRLVDRNVYLKREDTQPGIFSFKIRGAYNRMAHLSAVEREAGVVACSAGNHAQGVAASAVRLGVRAVIVMPLATPSIKVDAVRSLGAGGDVEVRLFGNNYDEAAAEAKRLVESERMTLVHPFDDPYVIAGQGTVAAEILRQFVGRPLDAIYVCCGGGGLLAGVAAYVKAVRPAVKVYGVEAVDAAGMTMSLRTGRVTPLTTVGMFADGAAVANVGRLTHKLCQKYVDGMITVTTDQLCAAIKLCYADARTVLEPAGALAVAGVRVHAPSQPPQQTQQQQQKQTVVAITSGANMDFDRLRFVSERADESETTVAVTIPERPGSFRRLCELVWPRNVTEFSYRHDDDHDAEILLSFQPLLSTHTSSSTVVSDKDQVLNTLRAADFAVLDLTTNELAKSHLRHLAGGRSSVPHEVLYRFEFPESPGALRRFLQSLDADANDHTEEQSSSSSSQQQSQQLYQKFNVSLFHYRNHGDDFGRVLVGIQVLPGQQPEFQNFLDRLGKGYRRFDETNNPAYQAFLRTNH